MKLAALLLVPLAAASAQPPLALTVRDVKIDATAGIVFDVFNRSTQPVHAWTMTVSFLRKISSGQVVPTNLLSHSCEEDGLLGPGETRHCVAPVSIDNPGSFSEPAVRITAVVFEDGAAEGDLALLDAKTREIQMCLRAARHWRQRLEETRSRGTPPDQLRAFEQMLAGADSSVPADLLYDETALQYRNGMKARLAYTIRSVENGTQAAGSAADSIAQKIQRDIEAAEKRSKAFPPRDRPYAALPPDPPVHPIVNRTASFRVVKVENQEQGLRLVLRNEYDREIVQYSTGLHRPTSQSRRTESMRHLPPGMAITPGSLVEARIGPVEDDDPPLEIECVVFRDGSGDGDVAMIQQLNDEWAAHEDVRAKVCPLVRALVGGQQSELPAAIDRLIAKLEAEDEKPAAGRSEVYNRTFRATRVGLTQDLRDLRAGPAAEYRGRLLSMCATP
jgi:hypothetical protein